MTTNQMTAAPDDNTEECEEYLYQLFLITPDEPIDFPLPGLATRTLEGPDRETVEDVYFLIRSEDYTEPDGDKLIYGGLIPLDSMGLEYRDQVDPEALADLKMIGDETWALPTSFTCPRHGTEAVEEKDDTCESCRAYNCESCEGLLFLLTRPHLANAAVLFFGQIPK